MLAGLAGLAGKASSALPLIGGVLGLGSGLKGFLGGNKGGAGRIDLLDPKQKELLNMLIGNVSDEMQQGDIVKRALHADVSQDPSYQQGREALGQLLQAGYNPDQIRENFQANVARPALEQFQQEIAPTIQQAAVAAGGGRSSMVPAQVARSGERLQSNLAGQLGAQLFQAEETAKGRQQMGIGQALEYANLPEHQKQQQLMQLANLLGMGISPSYQTPTYDPARKSPMGALGTVLGAAGGSLMGNPLLGAQLGGTIGSAF